MNSKAPSDVTADANIDVFADRLRDAPDAGLKLLASAAAAVRDEKPAANENVAGVFLEQEAPVSLALSADAALARIDALADLDARTAEPQIGKMAAGRAARTLTELNALPDPVREAAFAAIMAGGQFGFAGFGIRRLAIPMDSPLPGGGHVDLLRIEPGAGVANHDHEGEEFTLVLTGAFDDGHATFHPGDINVGLPGFKHEPKALPGEVCFALAVSYGSARFDGSIGLLQKLTGFGR
ncbi:MAG TPA: cupin domain-containing protein [Caulobacter sp.]|nr:cupin domain-containing protein [Caulobacter sp.]